MFAYFIDLITAVRLICHTVHICHFLHSGHIKRLCPWNHHLLQHCGLSHLLRVLRSHRSVRLGQCCHCCPDEAPGGEQQGGQRGGWNGGRVGDGEQGSVGRHDTEVTPAEFSGNGPGQAEFRRFPLEVPWRTVQGAGRRRPDGLPHSGHEKRLCEHQSRSSFIFGANTGGMTSLCVSSICIFVHFHWKVPGPWHLVPHSYYMLLWGFTKSRPVLWTTKRWYRHFANTDSENCHSVIASSKIATLLVT